MKLLPFGLFLNIGFAAVFDFLHDTDVLGHRLSERFGQSYSLFINVIASITGSSQKFLCKSIKVGNATSLHISAEVGSRVGT